MAEADFDYVMVRFLRVLTGRSRVDTLPASPLAKPGDGVNVNRLIMTNETLGRKTTKHKALDGWVNEMAAHCQPEAVFWCDGSEPEYKAMCDLMVESEIGRASCRERV